MNERQAVILIGVLVAAVSLALSGAALWIALGAERTVSASAQSDLEPEFGQIRQELDELRSELQGQRVGQGAGRDVKIAQDMANIAAARADEALQIARAARDKAERPCLASGQFC